MYCLVKSELMIIAVLIILLDTSNGRILSKEVWNDVRLVNGSTPWEGRVEVKVNNTWGTVCVDKWSIYDGSVVCRQLGYDNVQRIYSQVRFGDGTGPTIHDELGCTGHEHNLNDCPGIHDPAHVNCDSAEDAGIRCSRPVTRPENETVMCLETQFKCFTEQKCIPRRWLCDSQTDCKDRSDEYSLYCNKNCGLQTVSPSTRKIVGGTNAKLGSWPWMASLKIDFQSGVSMSNLCGGTLIDKYWILTAAHCFDNYVPTASSLRVVVGALHANTHDVTEKTLRVSRVIKHEGYVQGTYDNDIALVQLAHAVDISHNYIKTACIPIPGDKPFDMTSNCYVTGFGNTMSGRSHSGILQEAMVPIINNTICSGWYQQRIKNSTLCAGFKFGGVDACKGDSGGPLSCKRNRRWYVAGVVSWGEGCAIAQHPGIYTNVAYFATWIADVIHRTNVSIADIILG